MRRALFTITALLGAGTGTAHAYQYSDAQISQALLSTSWCSTTYVQVAHRTRVQRATFQSSGILTVSTNSESSSSGQYGSVYNNSSGGDTYRWQVRGGQLILSGDEGVQALTLDESRTSSGDFILLVDGQEWRPCD